ncbi:MAG: PhzF family phenazine biosynthesis protein [Burkholderiales bacterium]
MNPRRFKQVDVFTDNPYFGNPVAVVLDGDGLSDDEMQRFARWTNLSETTFVLPPGDAAADYRVRIFTPGGELPFAGHPTLGTCHGWLEAGGQPKSAGEVVQQCAVGLIRVRREPRHLAFAAPPCKMSSPAPALLAKVAAALGIQSQQIVAARLLDNGPVWLGLLLDAPQTVLALSPDHLALKHLGQKVGVAAIWPGAEEGSPKLEVRAFAAAIGIPEDPVTGSLNASLAQWLIEGRHLPARYLAAQGQCLNRAGRVLIERDREGQVWVGGESVTCIDGVVSL